MCKPEHVYRADGAMGQFTIVLPDLDMEIAINETAVGAHWAQSTLNITWDFIEKIKDDAPLPEDPEAYAKLQRKLNRLNIGNPKCQPFSPCVAAVSGKEYKITSGNFTPFGGNFMIGTLPDGIERFKLDFDDYGFVWDFVTKSGRAEKIRFSTNGVRFSNLIGKKEDLTQLYLGDAYWKEDNVLVMNGRWAETCIQDTYTLTFEGNKVSVVADNNSAWKFGNPAPICGETTE